MQSHSLRGLKGGKVDRSQQHPRLRRNGSPSSQTPLPFGLFRMTRPASSSRSASSGRPSGGPRRNGSRHWFFRLVRAAFFLLLAGVGLAAATYFYFDRNLPSVEELRNYHPPQVTKVYCADGTLCAEFYKERRTWVQIETLPPHVKNAFLAAEDADFYKHPGVDFIGILRAGVKTLLPGGRATGASTISQQTCKNLLLSQERTLARKIREWILTPRMEKALTKDQILNLYLNSIDFGHNRYGIEEASLFYFGKHASKLSLGEAAVLGGTPQRPYRINPVTNIVLAKKRQRYVLDQMAQHGFAPRSVVEAEMDKPIVLGPRPQPPVGPYYAEEIRRTLIARYGEQAVLEGGLRVQIAMNPRLQAAADEALRSGLEAVDRRQGYRGALGTLPRARFDALKPLIAKRIEESGKRHADELFVADLKQLAASTEGPNGDDEGAERKAPAPRDDRDDDEPAPTADELTARSAVLKPLKVGMRLAGYVTAIDDAKKTATVDLVSRVAKVSFASVSWARPRKDGRVGNPPSKISEVFKVGELVRIRVLSTPAAPAALEATLDQIPLVQGALVALDPAKRHVVALAGGYDFTLSAFNRATQAKRQPGSSFKPFLYAAAIASQRFTPLTVMNDAPEAIRDPYTGKMWKPQNYEKSGFEGPMTVRMALTKSKNTISVRLIESLTPQTVIDFAKKTGIRSTMPDNLTLALGTGEVSVLELANAYATLHSSGQFSEPVMLIKVSDAKGTVLEEHQAAFEEVIPPPVAFMATSLMRSVVEEGTATAVKELNRPAAGKTGTAQEFRDAWFSGYTADLLATAWVGFDNHDSLGQGETGGKAALPVWLSFMKVAHEGLPVRDFEPPEGVTFARVDPSTGLLAGASVPGRNEPFLDGTVPTEEAPPPGQVNPNDFLLHDDRKGGM